MRPDSDSHLGPYLLLEMALVTITELLLDAAQSL